VSLPRNLSLIIPLGKSVLYSNIGLLDWILYYILHKSKSLPLKLSLVY